MTLKNSFPWIFPSLFLLPQMLTGTCYASDVEFCPTKGSRQVNWWFQTVGWVLCWVSPGLWAIRGSFLMDRSVQFSSVVQSCLTLCDPMDCSTPDFPIHHQLLELAQTPVHRVSDAIQPSHSVVIFSFCLQSFPASGSFAMNQVAKISAFHLQHQSFQWIFRTDFL